LNCDPEFPDRRLLNHKDVHLGLISVSFDCRIGINPPVGAAMRFADVGYGTFYDRDSESLNSRRAIACRIAMMTGFGRRTNPLRGSVRVIRAK